MRIKKMLGVLLLAAICVVGVFGLTSCGKSEAAEVKELVIEYFKHENIDYSKGYTYTYEVVYNMEGSDGNRYNRYLPEKYYKVYLGVSTYGRPMYKGMYDNERN